MACNQWEEKGLLYAADELDSVEKKLLEDHILVCGSCRDELARYSQERNKLFIPAMFEETPSPAVDAEIIRVCSQPIHPAITATVFPSFIKNVIAALLILAVGFSGGAYFAGIKIASDTKLAKQNVVQEKNPAQETVSSENALVSQQEAGTEDSIKPSDSLPKIIKRGNLNMQGVVPVDLSDE